MTSRSSIRFWITLVIFVNLFVEFSVARYIDIRQAPTTTSAGSPAQASANNDLYATPSPTENVTEAALNRGVPFFLNDVITLDFLPNNGNNMC
jgi:hypothetical protein